MTNVLEVLTDKINRLIEKHVWVSTVSSGQEKKNPYKNNNCTEAITRKHTKWKSTNIVRKKRMLILIKRHKQSEIRNVDFLFIVTPIVGVCNCSIFCCTLLYVHSSIATILMGKRESWLLCLICLPGVS